MFWPWTVAKRKTGIDGDAHKTTSHCSGCACGHSGMSDDLPLRPLPCSVRRMSSSDRLLWALTRHARRRPQRVAVDDLERQGQPPVGAGQPCRRARPSGAAPSRGRAAPGSGRGAGWRPSSRSSASSRPASAQVSVMRSMSITGSAKPPATSMSPQSCMSVNCGPGGGQPERRVERLQLAQRVRPEAGEHQEAVDGERAVPLGQQRLRDRRSACRTMLAHSICTPPSGTPAANSAPGAPALPPRRGQAPPAPRPAGRAPGRPRTDTASG